MSGEVREIPRFHGDEIAEGRTAGTRIQSVARAAQLLTWLTNHPEGATVKEIALALELTTPTAYHLINTLYDQEFLAKDARRRYIFGGSVALIAQAYLRGNAVPERLLNVLRELAKNTGETVYLADWGDQHDIRVLASIEGSHLVRVAEVASGPYEHGHARANGKLLLAYAAPEIRESYLRRHPIVKLTDSTIASAGQLHDELERIRRRGVAYDEEEYAEGVCCVAAPVLRNDRITAAVGMSVPTQRFRQRRNDLTERLLGALGDADKTDDSSPPDHRDEE